VVIKGTACAGARRLSVHLMRTDTNEHAEVRELRGTAADSLRGALLEMEAVAAGTRTTKPFYHASINSRADERLTDEQRAHAIDRLEAELGLSGQPRVVVIHQKEGREHCHIVWSRIELERMRAISDSHNYRKHELVARELEREFGHERVQGAHIEREGKERPTRTPSHAEMLQAERTGLSVREVKEKITELWRRTDRRDFVVIDPHGGTHSLARRVEGAKVKDIRERMADLDPERLPNVVEAKKLQKARQGRDRDHKTEKQNSRETPREAPQADLGRTTRQGLATAGRATDGASRAAAAVLDGLAALFERGLFGDESQSDQARREPEPERREAPDQTAARQIEEQSSTRRQALLREFGRDIQNEQEAEIERGRERERRGE